MTQDETDKMHGRMLRKLRENRYEIGCLKTRLLMASEEFVRVGDILAKIAAGEPTEFSIVTVKWMEPNEITNILTDLKSLTAEVQRIDKYFKEFF